MMKFGRIILTFMAVVLANGTARAQQSSPDVKQPAERQFPTVRFGLEWGFSPSIFNLYHYNYYSEDGYRLNDSGSGFKYSTNGEILGHVGVNVSRKVSLSAISGDIGITKATRVIPALIRVTYYFNGVTSDGIFTYIDGGAGFHPAKPETPPRNCAWLAHLGGGYRLSLSREISLDILSSLRWTYDHALIPDPDNTGWIQPQNIRRDNAGYLALSLSIGLTF